MNLVLSLREKFKSVVKPLHRAPQRNKIHLRTPDQVAEDWYQARKKRTIASVHERGGSQVVGLRATDPADGK